MDRRLLVITGAASLVAIVAGVWLSLGMRGDPDDQFAACRGGSVSGGPGAIGGPFELVNGQGETVTDADVITEPTLVYFGYTFCPDICPFDAARNADAVDLLAERGVSATPVFVTVDPKRDTPEVVGAFADAMHEKMIGLTGTPAQIDAASKAYRTYYKAHDNDDEFYLVDHSSYTYLVLPDVGFQDFFNRNATPEEIADKVMCYVENS